MGGPYFELHKIIGIDVVGVEYSGYGMANGTACYANTYADVEAAYDYIVSQGVPPNRIVAYGQSVGSGPVSHLAVKRKLGGLILHSPLLSGIKVVDPNPTTCCRPSCVWHCFDFYPNDRRAKQMTCPVLVMHGQRDDIIPFYHGYNIHKMVPKAYRWQPYFPQRAGHNDIVESDMRTYFTEVAHFLEDVKKIASGLSVDPSAVVYPPIVEMTPKAERVVTETTPKATQDAQIPPGDFMGTIAEPKVGPEDGRYEQLRKGNVRMPDGPGNQVNKDASISREPLTGDQATNPDEIA